MTQRSGILLSWLVLLCWLVLYQPGLAQSETLAEIGPSSPRSTADCDRTLDPGDKIQAAIDAVRDKETPYVLCLRPGYYRGGMDGDTTVDLAHDFGDTVVAATAAGDWWNQTDDGPYYGNIVIKNRRNFTLRGLIEHGQRAVILGLPNDEQYPPEHVLPPEQHANDKGILIKVVNGDNITLEHLTIDGFYYPAFPDMTPKVAVLNRLIWFQRTTNSRIIGNIVKNAGGECIRIRTASHDNEVAYNTVQGCGYYQFKIQPLARLHKNGEGIYIGTDPYQIRANQINKQAYWGADWDAMTDGSHNNLIHHNDIFPGAQADLNPPPNNPLRAGVAAGDGYGNECIDIKEDVDTIGRLVRLPGVTKPQLINNVIRDNRCQGQFDEDSAALGARGSNNLFEHNHVLGTVRGAALRLGGGEPKPILVAPLLADPVKACTGTIVEATKWQAYHNRIRKNIFESYYNDNTDFNGRGGYLGADCDDEVVCSASGEATLVAQNCGEQKILYVIKTFDLADHPLEAQAPGAGVCGNGVAATGDTNWGQRLYRGQWQPVLFSRIPEAAVNLPTCHRDANNPADLDPPGIRGDCVGALCAVAAFQLTSPVATPTPRFVSPLATAPWSPLARPTSQGSNQGVSTTEE
ncbi:MAG: right-handed parallel beta-helix repeat-containing protein [Caldilineaceae bacterium]|nr:right-handed parallel beta-helix repeat-containing protein [Caldilineaceae bacterium]